MKIKLDNNMLLITCVCILFGFFAIQVFQKPGPDVEIGGVTSLQTVEKMLRQKGGLTEKKLELDETIAQREKKLAVYEDSAAKTNGQLEHMKKETQDARWMAGLLPVEGPGVEIILNDRKRDTILTDNPYLGYYVVHDSDMLNVINELREAGAEAIAVNDTRIMGNSRISCGGPTINVGKYGRFAPPFVIRAIGDPDALMASFQRDDSIYQNLNSWGLEVQIRKMSKIKIPRYLGDMDYKYAQAVQEGD
ncbi:DUF881 domain-containing protein [Eubacteriales bacterium mix99]|jgi:uncharacterized protein YlxW (UPF0749 family)